MASPCSPLLLCALLVVGAWDAQALEAGTVLPPPLPPRDPVLVAAGDIASSGPGDEETSEQVKKINPLWVLTMGDNAYPSGTASEFAEYFQPSWGRFKAKIKPTAGNHEHRTPQLAGYCAYFGEAGHCQGGMSYYAFDVGAWHLIALDSEPAALAEGSPMRTWLTKDLAQNKKRCTLAYWHHPRFSSGGHGNDARTASLWTELAAAHVDLVLVGHDHIYERFAPQDAAGKRDDAHGLPQIIVGTGGVRLYDIEQVQPNSLVRQGHTHGVLKLTLKEKGLDFVFVPVTGKTFTDQGTVTCH